MICRTSHRLAGAALCALLSAAAPAGAQEAEDRADPAITERALATPLAPPRAAVTDVIAPPPVENAVASVGDVSVGAIVVDGARSFRAAQFAPVLADYVGRRLSAAELKAVARAVADIARARGFIFASAWIPGQTLSNGVLRVRLDEGRIDEVRVSGETTPALTRALSILSDGQPVKRAELERALLLAGDLPGQRIAETRYQREGDRGVLLVEATRKRTAGSFQIDNWGSGSVGPVRLRMRTDINGVVLAGDQLSIRATLTPFQPRELATIGFDYAADTGLDGLLAGFGGSYTRVQPGDRRGGVKVDGRSTNLNVAVSYPLVRTQVANLRTTADFTVRDVEQDRGSSLVRSDRLATLSLGASGYTRWLGGSVYARVQARQGLDILGATRVGDALASRRQGAGVFSKLEFYADWSGALAGPLTLRLAAEGQLANRALLSSEEMGVGGPRFGRGYDYSELSGDKGIAGLAELRYDLKGVPALGRRTQVYAFADAGTVGNLGPGGRGGSLYSAGGGVRFDLSRVFDAGFEAGFPIGEDRYESGDRSPRLSFTLSARF